MPLPVDPNGRRTVPSSPPSNRWPPFLSSAIPPLPNAWLIVSPQSFPLSLFLSISLPRNFEISDKSLLVNFRFGEKILSLSLFSPLFLLLFPIALLPSNRCDRWRFESRSGTRYFETTMEQVIKCSCPFMRSRTHSFTRGLRRPRSRKYAGPCIFIYISFTIYIYTYARSGRFWKIIYYYYAPRSTLCTRGDFCFARKYPTRLPNFPRASARSNKISRANSPRNRSPPPSPDNR